MKKVYWILLIISAVAYGLSFLFNDQLWGLVFVFPLPLLYLMSTMGLSWLQAYVWSCSVFTLHLSGGVYVIVSMAHDSWPIGMALGIGMIFYHALFPAFLFWGVTIGIRAFSVQSPLIRLLLLTSAVWLFTIWTDWYSMWIFGIKEGYPLMHPLIVLAQRPALLCVLPIVGKQLLTGMFLLVPASGVVVIWYKNWRAILFFCSAVALWLIFWWAGEQQEQISPWHASIKSLPYMAYSTASTPLVVVTIVGNHVKKIIAQFPETEIIIMPESAFNVSNFADLPELIQLWSNACLGKEVHIIFGASRWHGGNYYNSLHWVYNGVLEGCHDKRHTMLLSERLVPWGNNEMLRTVYFRQGSPVTLSSHERIKLVLSKDVEFVPYICSEFFCNESPDDVCPGTPLIVIVNDSFFVSHACSFYIQKLLVLLARYKAIQWQRNIVYVSYVHSLFIDRNGMIRNINE